QAHDAALAVLAHSSLGSTWLQRGALPAARQHLEEGIARDTPAQPRTAVFRLGRDLGVACRVLAAVTLWLLGYPDQALTHIHEALALAHTLSHPYSQAYARVLDVCFISSLPVMQRLACKPWADKKLVQIVGAVC